MWGVILGPDALHQTSAIAYGDRVDGAANRHEGLGVGLKIRVGIGVAALAVAWGSSQLWYAEASAEHVSTPAALVVIDDAARATAQKLVGRYSIAGMASQVAGRDAAIEDVIAEMNVVLRPIARMKLREGNPVAGKLTIEREGDTVLIAFDGLVRKAKLDGSSTQVVGIQGDDLSYRVQVLDPGLRQVFRGDRGGRTNRLRRRSSGKIVINVTMTSGRLPKALKYRLTYRGE